MGAVLVLALAMATDPMRLGVTLLLISRPRPVLNLLVYWVGVMFVGVTSGVVVLTLMGDLAPALLHHFSAFAANPAVRRTQLIAGLLALLLATLINTGLPSRRRFRIPLPVAVPMPVEVPVPVGITGDPSNLLLQPGAPVRTSQWQWLSRAKGMLKGESLWVALAAGLGQGPAPPEYLVALVAILASGRQVGAQIGLAVLFNVVMLSVCELTLISYLAMPDKTQAFVGRLNCWVGAHRRQIVSVVVGVLGVFLVVNGSS